MRSGDVFSKQVLLSLCSLHMCIKNKNSMFGLVNLASRPRRLFCKSADDGTFGTQAPIKLNDCISVGTPVMHLSCACGLSCANTSRTICCNKCWQDDGTYGTKVPISIFNVLPPCVLPQHSPLPNVSSSSKNTPEAPRSSTAIFCNRCWSYECKHSPLLSSSNKAFFPFTSMGPIIDSGVKTFNSVIRLSVFSYNCMTLKENSGDAPDTRTPDYQSRALLLENLSSKGFHAIGLQETRTSDRTFSIPGYLCVASGHVNRNFGVELWLSDQENITCINPVSGSEELVGFDLEQLVIIHKEPRLMFISIGIQSEAIVFIVLHAPDQTHGTNAVTAWWTNLFSLISKYNIDLSTAIILGDFNLKFGSRISKAVGDHYRQKQHPGAKALHTWMLDHSFFLPCTFAKYHDTSADHTYIHTPGSLHRIDYVSLPSCTSKYPCITGTFDPGFSPITDHIGTWASFCLPLHARQRVAKSKIGYNPALFLDPNRFRSFMNEMALGTFSPHLFDDNTSRSHYYSTYTYFALCHSFPAAARAPIKPYISQATVDLISRRNQCRALYKHVRLNPHNSWWLPSLQFLIDQFKTLAKDTRKSVSRDVKNWCETKCSEAQAAHDNGDQRTFFQIKRVVCPRPAHTPTFVMDGPDVCVYYKDIRTAFQKYFSTLLQGRTLPVSDAISDIFYSIKQCGRLNIPIPTIDELLDITKKSKPYTAAGPDGLKYVVFQFFPWLLQTFYPIFMDACTNLPPTQWCASILHEILKGQGDPSNLANYRDVLLCDIIGKIFKRHFRTCMLVHIESYILETMCGGFLHRGVDFCSHFLRSILSIAKVKKMSCCALFVDVKTAFATVIRQLIYKGRMSDSDVFKLFHKFGFKPEIFMQFKAVLQGPSAMEAAKVPTNLATAFASFIGNSYFHTKGVESVVVYESGTGAGNPLADLAFAFLAARVLHEVDRRIHLADLQINIPGTSGSIVSPDTFPETSFTGASYVDDTFYCCIDKKPEECVNKIRDVCSIVIDTFSCHGLVVNFKYGKTGFLFQLRGPSAHTVLKDVSGSPPTVPVSSKALGNVDVFVYPEYKHVGSFVNKAGTYAQEAGLRCNAGRAAKKDIGRMARSNKLSFKSKVHLASSFGTPALFSNTASIPFWPKGSLAKVTKSYDSLYRAATISREDPSTIKHESTLVLFKKHSIPLCSNKLISVRLRYLRRVLVHAPPLLKHIIAYEWSLKSNFTWCGLIKNDLTFLKGVSPFLDHFPDPSTDVIVWHHFVLSCPVDFFRCIERILFEYPDNCDVYNLPPVPIVKVRGPSLFPCSLCGESFSTHQEASAHRFKKHGVKSTLRNKIFHTHCLYCCKEFHTRTKVHNHVAYRAKHCAEYYNHTIQDLDPELIHALETEETARVKKLVASGHSKLYHPSPCVRIIGPVPPPPTGVDS